MVEGRCTTSTPSTTRSSLRRHGLRQFRGGPFASPAAPVPVAVRLFHRGDTGPGHVLPASAPVRRHHGRGCLGVWSIICALFLSVLVLLVINYRHRAGAAAPGHRHCHRRARRFVPQRCGHHPARTLQADPPSSLRRHLCRSGRRAPAGPSSGGDTGHAGWVFLTSPEPRRGPYRHGAASSGWGVLAGRKSKRAGSIAPAGPRRQ